MQKPRNQTKKCEKLTTQKPKPTTNAKSIALKIIKFFHDHNICNMKHKMCPVHVAHTVTLIETQKPRQNDET
jgi:hypothetical protein